jgi:NADH-quinone oxidoreductase subunit K
LATPSLRPMCARVLPLNCSYNYTVMNITPNHYIFLSLALFCIGITGVLVRRNAIIVFMCIELMLNAVNLLLVAFSKMQYALVNAGAGAQFSTGGEAQLFVFFIMVVAAAEVSVGLAIIVLLYRNTHSVDINFLNRLKN